MDTVFNADNKDHHPFYRINRIRQGCWPDGHEGWPRHRHVCGEKPD